MKFAASLLSISATVLLTACSSEPSDVDIKTAIQRQMDAEQKTRVDAVEAIAGKELAGMVVDMTKDMMVELVSTKKLGCKQAKEQAGYNCDVEIALKSKLTGEQKNVVSQRFVKSDTGWVVVQ